MLFTRNNLLTAVSERELTALTARPGVTDADPTADAIARAQATVELHTARHLLGDDTLKGFISDLTLYYLSAGAAAEIPAKRQAAYEQVMAELRDIRDGKYPDLPLKSPAPADAQPAEGHWGGAPRIELRP